LTRQIVVAIGQIGQQSLTFFAVDSQQPRYSNAEGGVGIIGVSPISLPSHLQEYPHASIVSSRVSAEFFHCGGRRVCNGRCSWSHR